MSDSTGKMLLRAAGGNGSADGLLGSVAALIKVQSPYETAIAAAFGAAADAVAVTGVPSGH